MLTGKGAESSECTAYAFMVYKGVVLIVLFFASGATRGTDPWKAKREAMVQSQLIARGITNEDVLNAFMRVPRHCFVPDELTALAYTDQPLPIGEGQTISQPYVVAFMTESLRLRPSSKVLEIGTGSGYQAAILAEMDVAVFSIEVIFTLLENARKLLAESGYSEVRLKTGDGFQGWAEHAPFDAILVTCSPSAIPAPLKEQLAEGGRMIIPLGDQGTVQYLCLLEKRNGRIRQRNVLPVRFVPMVDKQGNPY